ncbi:MAG: hypothetical protein H6835_11855 [Planctomycetes bacterium]|nr:hypothetical protein [Planctomycetota bacterium]
MSLPGSLAVRLAAALVVAAAAIWLLAVLASGWDRRHPPVQPHRGDRAPVSADGAPVAPRPLRELALQPASERIGLARRLASLPPDVAPVVEVLPDGEVALLRPAPGAAAPDAIGPSPSGLGAGVLVPEVDLDELSPRARAALLGVIGALTRERPVAIGRIEVLDFEATPAALRRLLSWLP